MNTDLIQQMLPCGQRIVPFADERSHVARQLIEHGCVSALYDEPMNSQK